MRTVLQVPMSISLRVSATDAAKAMGFSSLQEVVRVLLNKLATKRLLISIEEDIVPLSLKNEKRYVKMSRDFIRGKNIKTAKNVDELMKQLNES